MPEAQESQGSDAYFDNEFFRFMERLTTDEFAPQLVNYIKANKFTSRAKKKLIAFVMQLLDREYAVTKLDAKDNGKQFYMLHDKLQILKAEFPLGLTKYDMSPELQWALSNVDMKWLAKVYRAQGGFERIRIQTQRHELDQAETPEQEEEREQKQRRWGRLGGFARGS